jgi:hypothetical protein
MEDNQNPYEEVEETLAAPGEDLVEVASEDNQLSGIIVKMSHVRQAHMCSRGTREFFNRLGLDWQTFIKDGLPVEVIEATGDSMAMQVAEVARGK